MSSDHPVPGVELTQESAKIELDPKEEKMEVEEEEEVGIYSILN